MSYKNYPGTGTGTEQSQEYQYNFNDYKYMGGLSTSTPYGFLTQGVTGGGSSFQRSYLEDSTGAIFNIDYSGWLRIITSTTNANYSFAGGYSNSLTVPSVGEFGTTASGDFYGNSRNNKRSKYTFETKFQRTDSEPLIRDIFGFFDVGSSSASTATYALVAAGATNTFNYCLMNSSTLTPSSTKWYLRKNQYIVDNSTDTFIEIQDIDTLPHTIKIELTVLNSIFTFKFYFDGILIDTWTVDFTITLVTSRAIKFTRGFATIAGSLPASSISIGYDYDLCIFEEL